MRREQEPRPSSSRIHPLILEAPVRPEPRQLLHYISRAVDELPQTVTMVIRFWLEEDEASS
jgi:hypothetical protein